MSGRQGGTKKPLKAAKKEKIDLDDDDKAQKMKLAQQKKEEAAMAAQLAGGKKLGSGLKKSGK